MPRGRSRMTTREVLFQVLNQGGYKGEDPGWNYKVISLRQGTWLADTARRENKLKKDKDGIQYVVAHRQKFYLKRYKSVKAGGSDYGKIWWKK